VIIFPLVGILVYLIARGGSMRERQEQRAAATDAAFRDYVRQAAASDGTTATTGGAMAGSAMAGSATTGSAMAGSATMAAGNGGASTASDELAKLAGLHQRGVLNDEEFERAKSRVV
jgi:hypothetical protein